jgi:hypothetical protein
MNTPEPRGQEHEVARAKRITGSRVAKIVNGTPAGWDTLSTLLHSNKPEKFFDVANTPNMPEQMARGHNYEPVARGEFFMEHPEYEVTTPMFLVPDPVEFARDSILIDWIGVSPDCALEFTGGNPDAEGSNAGGVEIKVPAMEKHLEYLKAGVIPAEYLPQVALSMLVTGKDWWFVSFCPELDGDERKMEILLTHGDVKGYMDYMISKILEFLDGHTNYRTFNQEEKSVVEVIEFPVADLGMTDKAIAILVDRYGKMEAPTNSTQYAVVKAANLDMVKRRTSVERKYKDSTKQANDYIKGCGAEKKRLQGLMESTEAHTKKLRTDWETKQERIKNEARIAEENRVSGHRSNIDNIVDSTLTINSMNSVEIKAKIELIKDISIDDSYEEFEAVAQQAKESALFRAMTLLESTVEKEVEAERVEKERIELIEKNDKLEKEAADRKVIADEEAEKLAAKLKEESDERDRVDSIKTQLGSITHTVIEAAGGTLEEAKDVRENLIENNQFFNFQEFAAQAESAISTAASTIDMIIEGKEAQALVESEKSIPFPEHIGVTTEEAAEIYKDGLDNETEGAEAIAGPLTLADVVVDLTSTNQELIDAEPELHPLHAPIWNAIKNWKIKGMNPKAKLLKANDDHVLEIIDSINMANH